MHVSIDPRLVEGLGSLELEGVGDVDSHCDDDKTLVNKCWNASNRYAVAKSVKEKLEEVSVFIAQIKMLGSSR